MSEAEVLNLRDGPQGRPIARLPEKKWYWSQKHSQRAKDTEYASTYCHESPREQLDEMLSMTFNDGRVQREIKLNLDDYPRSELRTAMMGWGPRMRQIYVPEIKTDSIEMHQHYAALGIPHEFSGVGDEKKALPEMSQSPVEKTLIPARPATHGPASKRPSIRALQGVSPVDGSSPLRSTMTRADGSPNMAATEYRGQFCKNVSMEGTIERTQVFMDGPVDFDQPDDFEQTKLSIRQRHTRESEVYNQYKDLVHVKDEAKRENVSVEEIFKKKTMVTYNDPYGTSHGSPKYHRPVPSIAKNPARISHLATLQKDLEWQPEPGILQSLTGKAGPSQITSHRNGFYGIQQAHSPRRSLKWGHTRQDRCSMHCNSSWSLFYRISSFWHVHRQICAYKFDTVLLSVHYRQCTCFNGFGN